HGPWCSAGEEHSGASQSAPAKIFAAERLNLNPTRKRPCLGSRHRGLTGVSSRTVFLSRKAARHTAGGLLLVSGNEPRMVRIASLSGLPPMPGLFPDYPAPVIAIPTAAYRLPELWFKLPCLTSPWHF